MYCSILRIGSFDAGMKGILDVISHWVAADISGEVTVESMGTQPIVSSALRCVITLEPKLLGGRDLSLSTRDKVLFRKDSRKGRSRVGGQPRVEGSLNVGFAIAEIGEIKIRNQKTCVLNLVVVPAILVRGLVLALTAPANSAHR